MISDYNHIYWDIRECDMADLQTFGEYMKVEAELMKLVTKEDV
jgi:hypothetical protein